MPADNDKKTFDNVPSGNIRRFPRLDDANYNAVIADLETQRAVLDQTIASLKAIRSGGALAMNLSDSIVGMGDSASVALHGGEVPSGAFHGKSIPEAAKLYLSLVNRKQSTREIAEALLKGGMESNSKNFEITVAGGLYRVFKTTGEIVRVKGAWGLAAWWPAGVRASQEKGKGRKAKKSRRQKSAKVAVATAAHHVESNGHKKPQEQIADLLRSNPSKIYTPQEVSQALSIDARAVSLTLGRLAASKSVEKVESGKYRVAHG
jgi:hypothetical protein